MCTEIAFIQQMKTYLLWGAFWPPALSYAPGWPLIGHLNPLVEKTEVSKEKDSLRECA